MGYELVAANMSLLNFAVASILGLQSLKHEGEGARRESVARIALVLFVLAYLSSLGALGLNALNGEFRWFESKGIVAAAAVGTLALMAQFLLRMRSIFAFAAPVATLVLLLHFFTAPSPMGYGGAGKVLQSYTTFHIVAAGMGQLLALVASLCAVLYLWQHRVLKKKLIDQLSARVPPLDFLERMLSSCLWAGFLFLTTSLVSGAFLVKAGSYSVGTVLPLKITWAIGVWLWYLSVLFVRNYLSCSTRRIAQMSLAGFVLLAISFFGLSFVSLGDGG